MSAATMVTFTAGRRTIGVALPDPALADAVAALLPAYANPNGHPTPDEYCTLRAVGTRWRFNEPWGEEADCATLDEALDGLEYLLVLRLLMGMGPGTHLHACGAVSDDTAVLALGASGAGKSFLARAWSQAGYPVLGDDIVLLDHGGRAAAFRRRFGLQLEPDREGRFDPQAEGAGWADPARVRTVAVIAYRPGPLVVAPLGASETLAALLGAVMPTGRPPEATFDTLVTIAQHARGLQVTFGDARDCVRVLA